MLFAADGPGIVALLGAGGRVVCRRCLLAETAAARLRGLLGRDSLESGEGMLLRPANAVHTAFMRFPIDVVFLDRDLTVLGIEARVGAGRLRARRRARAVLELPAGECERVGLRRGQQLAVQVSRSTATSARRCPRPPRSPT